MPKPHKNEKKSNFMHRCIKEVMDEGKTQDQAVGMCHGLWDEHHKAGLETDAAALTQEVNDKIDAMTLKK